MRYTLYQAKLFVLKKNPMLTLNSKYVEDFDTLVTKENYNEAYSDECTDGNSRRILEQLFEKFNLYHPMDFKGRSMSVSDVVVLERGNKFEYWFCDGIGFRKINGMKWLGMEEDKCQ